MTMAPSISRTADLSSEDVSSLRSVHNLLSLAAHRNRNQHRHSKWWSGLGILRRALGRVLDVAGGATAMGSGGSRVVKKSKVEVARGAKARPGVKERKRDLEVRLAFLREQVVPKAYLAFSAVVADNQYAALGLMLMGTLAQLCSVIGLGTPAEADVADSTQRIPAVSKIGKDATNSPRPDTDFGEVISREELRRMRANNSSHPAAAHLQGNQSTSEETKDDELTKKRSITEIEPSLSSAADSKPPKKKKKRRGDALDDVFAGLV
jgi:ribonuclease MRP protein subunit RMP1